MAKAIRTFSIIPDCTARQVVALALAGIALGAVIDLAVGYLGTAAAALIVVSPVALLSCLR